MDLKTNPKTTQIQTSKIILLDDMMSRRQGIRTHVLLALVMALVTLIVTGSCLLLMRHQLHTDVTTNLAQDLNHSVTAFEDMQTERMAALERENALLANLPTLKALMTSGDDLTIQDGAIQFWKLSGDDLFALADSGGRIIAVYIRPTSEATAVLADSTLRQRLNTELSVLLASSSKHYLISGSSLYACALRPLYFGSEQSGTLLGYVINGSSIERTVSQFSQPTGVEAAFLSGGQVVAGTLAPAMKVKLQLQAALLSGTPRGPLAMALGKTRFLVTTKDLSVEATSPLRLVVLASFEPTERSIRHINQMVLSIGLLALLCGTMLMLILARVLTRPLEELAKSVRAFGAGDSEYSVPHHGTQEVRQLSEAFAAMRNEIQQVNRALLESERLATIGRMANSVSHDFRHYLAAIYANAEFLSSDHLSEKERYDIFADIRTAVLGTTEMIESMLIFSRPGAHTQRSPELIVTLVERAVALARAHPDAESMTIEIRHSDPAESLAVVDGKQVERALFNLILNACQSARPNGNAPLVLVTIEAQMQQIIIHFIDNGVGVPESIRNSMFEPFVSQGKQKGTGLGLTLACCVAAEHGGEVILLSSRPGETIFEMRLARGALFPHDTTVPLDAEFQDGVMQYDTVQAERKSEITSQS